MLSLMLRSFRFWVWGSGVSRLRINSQEFSILKLIFISFDVELVVCKIRELPFSRSAEIYRGSSDGSSKPCILLLQRSWALQNPRISLFPRAEIYRGSFDGISKQCISSIKTLVGCSTSYNLIFPPGLKSIVGVLTACKNIVFHRLKRLLVVQNSIISIFPQGWNLS